MAKSMMCALKSNLDRLTVREASHSRPPAHKNANINLARQAILSFSTDSFTHPLSSLIAAIESLINYVIFALRRTVPSSMPVDGCLSIEQK
jgi:hypothetical protein